MHQLNGVGGYLAVLAVVLAMWTGAVGAASWLDADPAAIQVWHER